MGQQLKYLFLTLALMTGSFCYAGVFYSGEKVYMDIDSFKPNSKGDEFYIHTGNNVWLVTNTINRDSTGMFAFQCNLSKKYGSCQTGEYEKKWKCPYCYNYWPIGKACAKKDCPSKYE